MPSFVVSLLHEEDALLKKSPLKKETRGKLWSMRSFCGLKTIGTKERKRKKKKSVLLLLVALDIQGAPLSSHCRDHETTSYSSKSIA